jgi:hypothetical protein
LTQIKQFDQFGSTGSLYGFLTTTPNAVVEPIHPKAMPVILTTDGNVMSGCVGSGMKPRYCNGHCRMTR